MKKLKKIICIFAIGFSTTAFLLSCSQNKDLMVAVAENIQITHIRFLY